MSDPHEQAGISVTIKGDEPGGKYNDAKSPGTWIVFHGTPAKVREQIHEVFQIPEAPETPLFDLVNQATKLFKAAGNVTQSLGGSVLSQGTGANAAPASGAPASSGGDVWSQVADAANGQASQPAAETDELLENVEKCSTVDELQQLWAENQAAFAEEKYMSAYRAKGKALTAN